MNFSAKSIKLWTFGVIVSSSTIDIFYQIYTFYENRYQIYIFYENSYQIYSYFRKKCKFGTYFKFGKKCQW